MQLNFQVGNSSESSFIRVETNREKNENWAIDTCAI